MMIALSRLRICLSEFFTNGRHCGVGLVVCLMHASSSLDLSLRVFNPGFPTDSIMNRSFSMDNVTREKFLKSALVAFGAIFVTIYPLSLIWPNGVVSKPSDERALRSSCRRGCFV